MYVSKEIIANIKCSCILNTLQKKVTDGHFLFIPILFLKLFVSAASFGYLFALWCQY